ncbi:hypothetical protein BDA99DRAFT_501089 [Phascolomyces articulosus]|uniref:Uncharacterized protein n=1 Tax=Phascolomyces articulosus TaxID=60185 RepID=A0AAD5KND4_9FUNG|nr:hypothetical protein BDA99DRAFT_501089 [Phascolomyces articulosus]
MDEYCFSSSLTLLLCCRLPLLIAILLFLLFLLLHLLPLQITSLPLLIMTSLSNIFIIIVMCGYSVYYIDLIVENEKGI